jgi:hypothetical protein
LQFQAIDLILWTHVIVAVFSNAAMNRRFDTLATRHRGSVQHCSNKQAI